MKIKTITQMFVLLLNISFSLLATETYIASDLGYIKMDTTFNIPRVITCMQNGEYTGTVEDIASQYITENSMFLFKDASAKFEKIKIVNNPSGTHIGFQQVINNVPVIGSDIAISLNKKNEISMVTNNYKPSITIQTIPSISLGVAIQIARNSFDNPDFETMIPIKSQLSVYVNESYISFLVWKLNILSNEDDSDWYILINALDGSIVKKEDIAKSNYGRVFNPDPGTYLENIELLDNRDLDYPELSNAYKTVALEGLNPPVNGLYRLRGEYAYSIDIGLPNDPVTEEPTTEFNYNRSQNGFEEVNCYSHLDNEIRYVRELGFNPLWDNISVGYKDILFDARGTRTRNAAYFCTNDHIRFGVPVDNVDAGEDQSVIVHELGHALHDALIIDDISSGGPDLRGISEGISDYFGIDYRRQIERELGLPYFFPNARTNWFWPVTNLGPTIRSEYEANFSTWDLPGFIDEEYLYTDPYIRMRTWASSLMDLEYVSATEPSQGYRLGRDIVTTLQLASLSYITSYNDRYDNVLAMYQADIDIYDGMHLKDLIEVYSNRLLFYDQVISNNVVTNTTWDGYKLVNSDISVENGATLTIAPNTYFILYGNLAISTNSKIIIDPSVRIIAGPGAKITIQNGVTLNLNGVTIKGDDWAGIVAEPGSTINVLNSHFKGAQMAISGTPMICNISNSIFENCINGVSFIASKGLKIIGNSFSGLAEGSAVTVIQSSGNISQNNIVNYSKGLTVISCSPMILRNTIMNNKHSGLYIAGLNSQPHLVDPLVKISAAKLNNTIFNNGEVISTPTPMLKAPSQICVLSKSNIYLERGRNNIYSNPINQVPYLPCLLAYTLMPAGNIQLFPPIYARFNYWGSADVTDDFFSLGLGYSIIYDSCFTSPLSTTPLMSPLPNIDSKSFDLLMKALEAEIEGKSDKAIITFERIIEKYPNSPEALIAYAKLPDNYIEENLDLDPLIRQYDENLASEDDKVNKDFFKEMKVATNIKGKKYDDAITISEEMKLEADSEEEEILCDIDIAIAEMLKQTGNKSKINYSDKIYGLISKLDRNDVRVEPTEPSGITDDIVLPKETILYQNYPNPFNPVTQIKFAIAKTADVKLGVYNTSGQKVVELTNCMRQAGIHSVEFDGSRLNSGVYYYTLEADGKTLTQKMILMK